MATGLGDVVHCVNNDLGQTRITVSWQRKVQMDDPGIIRPRSLYGGSAQLTYINLVFAGRVSFQSIGEDFGIVGDALPILPVSRLGDQLGLDRIEVATCTRILQLFGENDRWITARALRHFVLPGDVGLQSAVVLHDERIDHMHDGASPRVTSIIGGGSVDRLQCPTEFVLLLRRRYRRSTRARAPGRAAAATAACQHRRHQDDRRLRGASVKHVCLDLFHVSTPA